MAIDPSSVFFLISDQGYHTFFTATQIQPRGWKKKNKRTNTDLGQLQAQEREFVTLCILRAFVDYRGRVYKPLHKPQGMLIHLCLLSLPPSADRPSPGLLSHADWSLLPTHLSRTFLPSSTSGLAVDLALSLLCGFRAKADQEILWPAHTPTQHNEWLHSVT